MQQHALSAIQVTTSFGLMHHMQRWDCWSGNSSMSENIQQQRLRAASVHVDVAAAAKFQPLLFENLMVVPFS